MRGISVGKIFDIRIELHWTFVFLAAFITFTLLFLSPASLLPTLMIFFFLFMSVLLHELSHSIVAMQLNAKVKKIILLPIGGVTIADELPEDPKDEFMIAFAGPLFNFILVAVLLLLVNIFPLPFPHDIFSQDFNINLVQAAIFQYPLFALFWLNLVLGAFNLFLPALPLDGGRVFRSLLGIKLGFPKATHIISKLSTLLAAGLFVYGLLGGGLIVLIISVFVYLGAKQEDQIAVLRETAKNLSLTAVLDRNPMVLNGNQTFQEALDEMITENKTAFLVRLANGYGVLELRSFAQKEFHPTTPLHSLSTEIPNILHSDSSARVLEKFVTKGYTLLPVLDENNALMGVIYANELEKEYRLSKLKKIVDADTASL